MSDLMDEASEHAELMLQSALSNRKKVPEKTGFCQECEEPTEGAFCSRECREDFERRIKMNAINGKKD